MNGASYRVIARQYSVGHDSLKRHVDGHHIDTAIKQAQAEKDEARALDVARQLNNINQVVTTIMYNALRDKKGHGLALAASDRILKQLDFQHRVNQLDELEREVEALKAALQVNDGDTPWQQ